MVKSFWGYNNEAEARLVWGELLDKGTKTTKTIQLVDDSTKWPQAFSTTKTLIRVELPNAIIGY